MFCPNCGKENGDGSLFCEQCGSALAGQASAQAAAGSAAPQYAAPQSQHACQGGQCANQQATQQMPGQNPGYGQAPAGSQYSGGPYAGGPVAGGPYEGGAYGNSPYAPDGTYAPYASQMTDTDRTLRLVAFILCILSTVAGGILVIPLAWMIPMTVHSWGIYKGAKANTVAFGVCTLLFVNLISGILLLCSNKEA